MKTAAVDNTYIISCYPCKAVFDEKNSNIPSINLNDSDDFARKQTNTSWSTVARFGDTRTVPSRSEIWQLAVKEGVREIMEIGEGKIRVRVVGRYGFERRNARLTWGTYGPRAFWIREEKTYVLKRVNYDRVTKNKKKKKKKREHGEKKSSRNNNKRIIMWLRVFFRNMFMGW